MKNLVKILFAFLVGFVFTACGIKSTYTGKSADELSTIYNECHNKELDKIDREKFCAELFLNILPVLNDYCNANEAQACFEVGELLMMGTSVSTRGNPPLTLSAIEAYKQACALGLKKACDEPFTKDKIAKSCQKGIIEDCLSLGRIYYNEKQYSKARKHFEVQCDLEGNDENEEYANNNECYYMGKMSALGQGTDKNLFQAKKYFDKACSYGDPRDDYCGNVVSLYKRGDEVIGIPPKGRQYYYYVHKYCDSLRWGKSLMCEVLAHLYENGE